MTLEQLQANPSYTLRHLVRAEEGYFRILTGEELSEPLVDGPVPLDELAERIRRLGPRWGGPGPGHRPSARNRKTPLDSRLSWMPESELSGVSIVGAGTFNPAIIHPSWLSGKSLITDNAAEHAIRSEGQALIVTPQLAVFVADWLSVQVTQEQAVFATVDAARESDLRDFAVGVFELLPETPVNAIGINADSHFRVHSEAEWHAFGDKFLPKDFWEPIFTGDTWRKRSDGTRVGMRVMTVEVHRDDPELPGWVRAEVAPSVRIGPHGIFVGINGHFQIGSAERRGTAGDAARVVRELWTETRALESDLLAQLMKSI